MKITQVNSTNPDEHARNIQGILNALKEHCRSEINLFPDPHGKALLETTAEVLGGLEKAFHDFLAKEEDAWKDVPSNYFERVLPQESSDPWD